MKQGWAALAAASIVMLASLSVSAQGGRPRVSINEIPVSFSSAPRLEHGVLMAPIGPLAASFGAAVVWDDDSRTGAVTSAAGVTARLRIGVPEAVVGGLRVTFPAAPYRRVGVVWVPAAALLRVMGAFVKTSEGGAAVEAISQVTDVTWRRERDGLILRIAATGPVKVESHLLTDPDRLAVDIVHAVLGLKDPKIDVADADVVAVRAAQFNVRPYVARIVLDLMHPVPYLIAAEAGGVSVTIRAQGTSRAAAREHPDGEIAPEPLARPALPEFADGPGAFHLRAVRYAVENGTGRLTIAASQPVTPVIRQFVYPDRLTIDLPGAVFLPRRQDLEVGSDAVRNIVVEQLQVQPNLARVVLYLRHKAAYATFSTADSRGQSLLFADVPQVVRRPPAIVIDPGHGGADSGAVGPTGLREADVALGIGRLLREDLERRGMRAVLTRSDDTSVALEERPDIARRERGIVFVSIHTNASVFALRRGTETYYGAHEGAALAASVQTEIVKVLGEPDRGIRAADFYVLVNTPIPAVLIETAFISNPVEERLLRSPTVQRRLAGAIARAIVRYLGARTAPVAP